MKSRFNNTRPLVTQSRPTSEKIDYNKFFFKKIFDILKLMYDVNLLILLFQPVFELVEDTISEVLKEYRN